MSVEEFGLNGEKTPLLLLGPRGLQKVNNHETTAVALSERRDYASKCNRGISKDGSIRYLHSPTTQSTDSTAREFLDPDEGSSNMAVPRALSFVIGVCYTVFALAAAAASLGYRYDYQNDGYGFRALLEGTALLATVTFLASLGLVYGIVEGRSNFVSAWLVVQVVVPLYSAAFYVWAIFESGYKDDFGPIRNGVPIIAMVAAVHIIVMIVCTMVVNNYYMFLKLRETMKKKEETFDRQY